MKKNCFTLIELFIALSIIGIVATIIGVKLASSLSIYRFEKSIERINDMMKVTKELAISNQADMVLFFYQEKNGLHCYRGSDEKQGLFRGQKREEKFFEDVYFMYNDEIIEKKEIIFSSTGQIIPNGEFIFSNDSNFKKESCKKRLILQDLSN